MKLKKIITGAVLSAGLILVAGTIFPGSSEAGRINSSSGVWLDVGHESCGPDHVCADWFAMPEGYAVTTCCISRSLVGSSQYADCSDFREVHAPGSATGHDGEP